MTTSTPLPRDLETWLVHLAERSRLETCIPAILQATTLTNVLATDPALPLVTGSSRIGGQPDLLSAKDWPSENGVPMRFLAQLRLGDLVTSGVLPKRGVLAFFRSQTQGCVLFTPGSARDLVAIPPPERDPKSFPGEGVVGEGLVVHRSVVIGQVSTFDRQEEAALDLLRTAISRALPGGDSGARVVGRKDAAGELLLQMRDAETDQMVQFVLDAESARKAPIGTEDLAQVRLLVLRQEAGPNVALGAR